MSNMLQEKYYTGKEVQQILGITEPALRNLVNQKKIRKVIPPGRRNGVYLKPEIDRYAEKWFAFLAAEEMPQTIFTVAKSEDMDEVYELSKRAIGATMNAEVRRVWLAKSPNHCYVVKHNKKVVAFIHLLPVKHETMMQFMDGKIRGWNIKEDDVEDFTPNKPVECLVMIASEPEVDETTRTHYMFVLLRGLNNALKELGQAGARITKIYATSESPTGIAMALHLGMEEMPPRANKRIRFILDVENGKPSFLIKNYRDGWKEWRAKNQEI